MIYPFLLSDEIISFKLCKPILYYLNRKYLLPLSTISATHLRRKQVLLPVASQINNRIVTLSPSCSFFSNNSLFLRIESLLYKFIYKYEILVIKAHCRASNYPLRKRLSFSMKLLFCCQVLLSSAPRLRVCKRSGVVGSTTFA